MPTQWLIQNTKDACFPPLLFLFIELRSCTFFVVLCFSFNIGEFKDPGERSGKCWGTFFWQQFYLHTLCKTKKKLHFWGWMFFNERLKHSVTFKIGYHVPLSPLNLKAHFWICMGGIRRRKEGSTSLLGLSGASCQSFSNPLWDIPVTQWLSSPWPSFCFSSFSDMTLWRHPFNCEGSSPIAFKTSLGTLGIGISAVTWEPFLPDKVGKELWEVAFT